MKDEKELLELFKVEELEKRYEMGKWRISGNIDFDTCGCDQEPTPTP